MPYQPTWNNPYMAQNPYQQPTMQPQTAVGMQYQQPFNGIVKVNGPASALQVNLPPNSTSNPMIDSNFDGSKGTFYVVSTDGTGTKSIETFDFTKHVDVPVQVDNSQFVSRHEFDELAMRVNAIIGVFNGTYGPVQTAGHENFHGDAPADDAGRPDAGNQ